MSEQVEQQSTTQEVEYAENGEMIHTLDLPSGAKARVRKPGILGQRKLHAVLPILDVTRISEIALKRGLPDEVIDGMIRLACVMCIDPKLSDDDNPPKGRKSIDSLPPADATALIVQCTHIYFPQPDVETEEIEKDEDVTDPLPETTS